MKSRIKFAQEPIAVLNRFLIEYLPKACSGLRIDFRMIRMKGVVGLSIKSSEIIKKLTEKKLEY